MIRQNDKKKCLLTKNMIIKEEETMMKHAFFLLLTLTLILTTSSAFGYGNIGSDVDSYCQPTTGSTPYADNGCALCHVSDRKTWTEEKTQAGNGNYAYFCPETAPVDIDGDGYTVDQGDCDDNDPLSYPGATEYCNDGVDNDCNGRTDCLDNSCSSDSACLTCTDQDKDNYAIEGGDCGPRDCKDDNLSVHPGAVELCGDGIDNDCDGLSDCQDADCNGDDACAGICIPESRQEKGKKCRDGIDNDCDGVTDTDDNDCVRTKGGRGINKKK